MVHHECDKLPSYSSMHSVFERIDRSLALLHEAIYIIPDNTTEQMHICKCPVFSIEHNCIVRAFLFIAIIV